jgi:hypothetical protein
LVFHRLSCLKNHTGIDWFSSRSAVVRMSVELHVEHRSHEKVMSQIGRGC